MNLDEAIQQQEFAELVGVSEAAVSGWVTEGRLARGGTGREWLLNYCQRLREAASGRDGDSTLVTERARLAAEQADRVAMENAIKRKQVAPFALLEAALAHVARQMVTRLEALVPQLRRRCPDLPGEALRYVEEEIASVRAAAASITLDAVTNVDGDPDAAAPGDPLAEEG